MTLRSVYEGEGFGTSPGQFLQILERWIYENRSSDLMAYIEQLQGQSASEQAELLVEWMDGNASKGQIDSCIQFLMDDIGQADGDHQDIYPDDDCYESFE